MSSTVLSWHCSWLGKMAVDSAAAIGSLGGQCHFEGWLRSGISAVLLTGGRQFFLASLCLWKFTFIFGLSFPYWGGANFVIPIRSGWLVVQLSGCLVGCSGRLLQLLTLVVHSSYSLQLFTLVVHSTCSFYLFNSGPNLLLSGATYLLNLSSTSLFSQFSYHYGILGRITRLILKIVGFAPVFDL